MDEHLIGGRINLAELESMFGVQFQIAVDEEHRLYHIMVSKDPLYKHNILTESMVRDMSDEDLMLAMKNFAKEVFDAYYSNIF